MSERVSAADAHPDDVRIACERCRKTLPAGALVITEPSMAYENVSYLCHSCFWTVKRGHRELVRRSAWERVRLCALVVTSVALTWMVRGAAARRRERPPLQPLR